MSIQSNPNNNSIFSNIPQIPMPSTSENFKSQCASYIDKAIEAFEVTNDSDYEELINLLSSVENLNTIDPSTFFKSKDVEPLISKLSEWESQQIELPSSTLQHESRLDDLQKVESQVAEILSTLDFSSDESEISSSDEDRPSYTVLDGASVGANDKAEALGLSDESDSDNGSSDDE
jgi:hypothetical protein